MFVDIQTQRLPCSSFNLASLRMVLLLLLALGTILDVVAFAFAVAAEQRRSSAQIVTNETGTFCMYEDDTATSLGIAAIFFLVASQFLIMVASKCFCCGKSLNPGRSRALAMFFLIACWVTFIVAEACLIAGSVRNAYHSKYIYLMDDTESCEVLRKGVFGAGAAFVVFTAIFSKLYYTCYYRASDAPEPIYERHRQGDGSVQLTSF